MITNEVFGELEFDYTWYKDEEIMFNDKKENIVLLVAGDEDGEFESLRERKAMRSQTDESVLFD